MPKIDRRLLNMLLFIFSNGQCKNAFRFRAKCCGVEIDLEFKYGILVNYKAIIMYLYSN